MIDVKIPLPVSLKVMMKLGMSMKFSQDGPNIAVIEGTKFEMKMREDHIWIDVSPTEQEDRLLTPETRVLLTRQTITKEDIAKVHVQMAHPPKEKMLRILRRAQTLNEEVTKMVDTVYEECLSKDCRARDACQKIRKVGARLPEHVGDMVCADLKIGGKNGDKDVLYIIDMFSNYVIADVIQSKRPDQIVEKFLELWVSRGLPKIKVLMTDCGREFLGSDMERFVEFLNIKHITTVPRTPQMNGQCERVHALVDNNAARLREGQPGITQKQALGWALYAWNTEEKRHGFSPADLVFGPVDRETCLTDLGPTELQVPDVSAKILNQLQARERARIEHLRLKASDKIRDALYRKTIPSREKKVLGTWVWMKRSLEDEWRGPGQICHSLNADCSVKIGNTFYTARHEDCLPLNQKEMELAGILGDTIETAERYELPEPAEIEVIVNKRNDVAEDDNIVVQDDDNLTDEVVEVTRAESPPAVPAPVGQPVEAVDEVRESDDQEQIGVSNQRVA